MQKENNFLLNLFEKEHGIPEYYESISFINNGGVLYKTDAKGYHYPNSNALYHITFFPDYLAGKFKNESELNIKKFNLVKGYCIDLTDFQDVDSYLKHQFKKNAKTIRRFVNRLESCFNIEYKFFYGQIPKEEYNHLLATLRKMILQRFEQRNEESKIISKWDRTVALTYPLLLKKRASIFVIYDNGNPIEIAINYHFNQILFSYISSYDIDYSKFGLGHVEIYKQLEWCLENNFNKFEMGWGDLDYKRRWSNLIYNFEQYLFYQKMSFIAKCKFKIKELTINIKLYLISKNVHIYVRKLKKQISRKGKSNDIDYEIVPIENPELEVHFNKIDHHLESYTFLKKIINDFLYSSIEHVANVEVHYNQDNNTYIIKVLQHAQKVIFKK
ncbi:GNAT family N-acetyltransferase [Maribacter polysiphoniae]|uniref:Acetyltransferase (GNAT) family protein n=1 Tax=Maribacter polysiphoniae TaxID=429344 RepID=A0A316DVV9_9FLAO|nr:GNAT family N-acetyltransferase [Maribacter polysiphoniae]MBD1262795.1 GNAT family N-acetyltransferase [Maribacter polysiphoniae]PWK21916.1 acetyltransferase (GNAT) family protein [Maribacter polysiphoniae]